MCCAGSDAIQGRKQGCWRGRRRAWFSDSLSKGAGMGWDWMGWVSRPEVEEGLGQMGRHWQAGRTSCVETGNERALRCGFVCIVACGPFMLLAMSCRAMLCNKAGPDDDRHRQTTVKVSSGEAEDCCSVEQLMTVVHASSAVLCRLGLSVGNRESGVGRTI